jgi:hypothetical protein
VKQRRIRVVSYRRVFRTDWRIRRVWDFDLTKMVPGGIPAQTAAWVFGTVLVVYLLSHTPGTGLVMGLMPGWFRYGSLAVIVAFAARQEAPDGRSIHIYLWARTVQALRDNPEEEETWEEWQEDLPVRWDISGAELRRGRVHGPAKVRTNAPVRVAMKNTRVTLRADAAGELQEVDVKDGERLEVYA